ncbi:MAG: adenosine deaminase [bacterium]|nr:adenosine deaminase [bacterium]
MGASTDAIPEPRLCELHSHLYGCLKPEDLEFLARRRPPRREIFLDSYRRNHGVEPPEYSTLFAGTPESRSLLERYYYFLEPAEFRFFQTCFDLIISVAHTDPEELALVSRRVAAAEDADYAEYRVLFPPRDSPALFGEKVHAICEGLRDAERDTGRTLRLVPSLWREQSQCDASYDQLRSLMHAQDIVRNYTVGVDFCHVEEGHPPAAKREFFARVLADNRADPGRALAILYHVGESFEDKSVESAARWVLEAAQAGAHRLGHAIALGVNPDLFQGPERGVRREVVSERLDQIAFELQHRDSLRDAGYAMDVDALMGEAKSLAALAEPESHSVAIEYDEARRENLRIFQDWAMQGVRETGAVVESCPSSNLRIARLEDHANHPLARFLAADLPVVIGADDPGILKTGLQAELDLVADWPGVGKSAVETMLVTARRSRSDRLAGRQPCLYG